MNYIAGSLFLIIQDEEKACKSLSAMIEAFSMSSLFTNNLKKLKKLFYILDRLIVIKLPELNENFKDVWVFSDHFSSAWFLTLFSSTLHSRLDVLVKIWDLFFLYG
jgi:GTPase-activating protein